MEQSRAVAEVAGCSTRAGISPGIPGNPPQMQRGGVAKEQLVHAGEVIPLPALVLGQGVVDAVGGI
jgi:hypothetical protein